MPKTQLEMPHPHSHIPMLGDALPSKPFPRADLSIELENLPLPRSKGWSYIVSICDWVLFEANSYEGLFGEHKLSAQFHYEPGQHQLQVYCRKPDSRSWRWTYPIVASKADDIYVIEKVTFTERYSKQNKLKLTAGTKVRVVDVFGTAEIISMSASKKRKSVAVLAKATNLDKENEVLITGPDSSVLLDLEHKGKHYPVLIRELSIIPIAELRTGRVDDISRTARASAKIVKKRPYSARKGPQSAHTEIRFGSPDWHACCSVRG
jgi:hypothetical protein